MSNWRDWGDRIHLVYLEADETLSARDKEVLRNIMLPLGVALAQTAQRPQFYLSLAECYSKGECTELTYDPKRDAFVYKKNGRERELNPDKFIERGFLVCRSKDTDDIYIRFGIPSRGGLSVSYEGIDCYPGDERLGSIHLHPAGAVFPSGADMIMSIFHKYNCISGKYYDPEKKRDYARVFCAVTDDAVLADFLYEGGNPSPEKVLSLFPEVFQLNRRYEIRMQDVNNRYAEGRTLVVKGADGEYTYVFPPPNLGALNDYLEVVRDVFRDTHKFELYVADLSDSKPPDLNKLER